MSLQSFDTLIKKFPSEAEAIQRLELLFERGSASNSAFTTKRLYDISETSSVGVLIKILHDLVIDGTLRQFVRVESEAGGGLGDFESVIDVPEVIKDFRLNRDVCVRPEQIQVMYSIRNVDGSD